MEGRTLGLFCFDCKFLSRHDFSANRFAFFIETLKALRTELQHQGGDLLVMDAPPKDAFATLFSLLRSTHAPLPHVVTWNRDYEPFARHRDHEMEQIIRCDWGIPTHTDRDHLVLEPDEVTKDDGPYAVYSPFYRKWRQRLSEPDLLERITSQSSQSDYYERLHPSSGGQDGPILRQKPLFFLKWKSLIQDRLPDADHILAEFAERNQGKVTVPIPEAGSAIAYRKMLNFADQLAQYKDSRDFPTKKATSNLSIYLKNGSLTTAQIIYHFRLLSAIGMQAEQYLKELVWREFYYSILFHHPNVEHEPYQKKYADLPWCTDKNRFQRWCDGTTGVPIVDAGMRQLRTTGLMHNRIRMVVASFLTKDLLIDWRWGADYFMHHLLDGDLAPNNGGWQWAASTGCDPQPYFRIFNPWLQSKKFDPDGQYIREYVHELKDAPTKILHDESADRRPWGYPPPIVIHAQQRSEALKLFAVTKNHL